MNTHKAIRETSSTYQIYPIEQQVEFQLQPLIHNDYLQMLIPNKKEHHSIFLNKKESNIFANNKVKRCKTLSLHESGQKQKEYKRITSCTLQLPKIITSYKDLLKKDNQEINSRKNVRMANKLFKGSIISNKTSKKLQKTKLQKQIRGLNCLSPKDIFIFRLENQQKSRKQVQIFKKKQLKNYVLIKRLQKQQRNPIKIIISNQRQQKIINY